MRVQFLAYNCSISCTFKKLARSLKMANS